MTSLPNNVCAQHRTRHTCSSTSTQAQNMGGGGWGCRVNLSKLIWAVFWRTQTAYKSGTNLVEHSNTVVVCKETSLESAAHNMNAYELLCLIYVLARCVRVHMYLHNSCVCICSRITQCARDIKAMFKKKKI